LSIKVDNLTKTYGQQNAINNISFEAKPGEILGLLGPNGAGKTTTMKILTCFMPATHGEASICGLDVKKDALAIRKKIGYLPEHNPLYKTMYVKEYLQFVAAIHKINKPNERINEVIEFVGLSKEKHKKIDALSKGYRQRVGLAQAIIHDPEVLILDEPISGLDPNQLVEIRALINNLKQNKTIIFSSHILQEVESICDKLVILDSGNIVADGSLEGISQSVKMLQQIVLECLKPIDFNDLGESFQGCEIEILNNNKCIINNPETKDIRGDIFDWVVSGNNKILNLSIQDSDLEDVFKSVTK